MKLLFDANISHKIVPLVETRFPGSQHIRDLGLERAGDRAVWDLAVANDFVIVSKDEDFHQLAFLEGPPPKVVWIRLGNCSTSDIAAALVREADRIGEFVVDTAAAFLVISRPHG